jgi:hypothetical protein
MLLQGWDPSDPKFSHYMDKTNHNVAYVPQTNNWECGYACICNLYVHLQFRASTIALATNILVSYTLQYKLTCFSAWVDFVSS